MSNHNRDHSRRSFLAAVGEAGAAAALVSGAGVLLPAHLGAQSKLSSASAAWDLAWIERVRKAAHRAVFDAPSGSFVVDLAMRYVDNVRTVFGDGAGDICAVLNVRTRAVSVGLSDAIWQKYPLGEDYTVNDPRTGAPARRNVNWQLTESELAERGGASLERLHQRGAIVLVCDFALGHLAKRLAAKLSLSGDVVHAELRAGLVPGGVLVPSGIFGAAQAQNAGCAFIPA
jgi:hypothetical protein